MHQECQSDSGEIAECLVLSVVTKVKSFGLKLESSRIQDSLLYMKVSVLGVVRI
jgi:hypothetical protein